MPDVFTLELNFAIQNVQVHAKIEIIRFFYMVFGKFSELQYQNYLRLHFFLFYGIRNPESNFELTIVFLTSQKLELVMSEFNLMKIDILSQDNVSFKLF